MAATHYYVDANIATGSHDGSSWANAYATLALAEAGLQKDLDTANEQMIIHVRATAGTADASKLGIDGWVTSATDYLSIIVDDDHRAKGKWDATKYRIIASVSSNAVVEILDPFHRVFGIQAQNTNTGGYWAFWSRDAGHVIDSCVAYNTVGSSNAYNGGFATWDNSGTTIFVNCLAMAYGDGYDVRMGGSYYYNCVAINCGDYGFFNEQSYIVLYIKNCYSGANVTDDANSATGTWNITTCASSDGTLGDTVACSVSAGTYFTNVTAGSEDVHIASASSALINDATDLSGDGTWPFTTDMDGVTRVSWDTGCEEYIAAGGGDTYSGRGIGRGIARGIGR